MRRIKIQFIIAVFATVLLVLAACGSKSEEKSSTDSGDSKDSNKQEEITLTFWTHNSGPMVEQTEKLIAEYEEENPNIKIDYQAMPNDQFAEKTTISLGTSTGPDLFLVSDRNVPTYASKGVMKELDPSYFGFDTLDELKEGWIDGSLDGLILDGDLYGIPMELNSFNLFINTKAFEAAGLDIEKDAPKTWDELADVANKLTIREDGKLVQAGFDWPMFNGGWNALVLDPMVRQLGGMIVEDYGSTVNFNSPEVIKVFQTWQDIYHKHKAMDVGFGTHAPANPNEGFTDEQLAMWISGPWAIPMITEDTKVGNDYVVVPLPTFDENNPVTTLYSWNWAVNSETEYPKESWKFINFLSGKQEEWLESSGYIQPRKGWLDSEEAQAFPFMDVWEQGMENGHYIIRSEEYGKIIDIIERAMDRVINDNENVETVLEETQKEAEKIFE